jgi:hypothetical protein
MNRLRGAIYMSILGVSSVVLSRFARVSVYYLYHRRPTLCRALSKPSIKTRRRLKIADCRSKRERRADPEEIEAPPPSRT